MIGFEYKDNDSCDQPLKRITPDIMTPVAHDIINHELDIYFGRLVSKFNRLYSIHRASLAFVEASGKRLKVTHIHENGRVKSGLALALKASNSVLYQILLQGFPVADNYPNHITANLVEKKIILADSSKSALIIPLSHDGFRFGTISLASPREHAFGTYLNGTGEDITREFVSELVSTASAVAQ